MPPVISCVIKEGSILVRHGRSLVHLLADFCKKACTVDDSKLMIMSLILRVETPKLQRVSKIISLIKNRKEVI